MASMDYNSNLILSESNLEEIQEQLKSNEKNLVIFNDVGEEIDDLSALCFLIKYILYHFEKKEYDKLYNKILISFTNGAPNTMTPDQRFNEFKKHFPEWETYTFLTYVTDLSLLNKITGVSFESMLRIAPLTGVSPNFFQNNTFESYYLMGTEEPTPCFNTTGTFPKEGILNSETLWEEYQLQEAGIKKIKEKVVISTPLCLGIPFTNGMINALPPLLQEMCLKGAFKMFAGRVPPHLPYCSRVTFVSNLGTLENYVSNISEEWNTFFESVNPTKKEDMELVKDYWKSISVKPADSTTEEKVDEYILKLYKMFLIVKFMTGETYTSSTFSFDSLSNYENAFAEWSLKVCHYKCSLTPAYDLTAMFAMLNKIPQEVLVPENSQELISSLEKQLIMYSS